MIATNPDLIYADQYKHPRMSGQQPLLLALQAYLSAAFNRQLVTTQYGKPSAASFEFAIDILKQQANELGVEMDKIYMIGDNPAGDILGANQCGLESILVQSGIYRKGDPLPEGQKPIHEVADMHAAFDLILNQYI